ncbi:hypothetical protein MNBD_PLANCTO02-1239 [hydrothermal vent metagenome]|uniref:RNA polymerase sigma-70 region 2 domain-containing protein n=1 Tax=hydrothermal vent metagenome TaxID=652676 RepID=A0A3B1D9L7_9ZZZZ
MTNPTNQNHQDENREKATEFVWHYTMHSRRIYTYVYSLVFDRSDADDIYQDVGILLWEKFDQFEKGSNFAAWACKIAWLKVLEYRRKKKRLPAVLDQAVLERLSSKFEGSYQKADAERDALENCLAKLSEKDSQLIIERYQKEGSPQQLALNRGQAVERVYTSLKRIRRTLLECVTRTLSGEASP